MNFVHNTEFIKITEDCLAELDAFLADLVQRWAWWLLRYFDYMGYDERIYEGYDPEYEDEWTMELTYHPHSSYPDDDELDEGNDDMMMMGGLSMEQMEEMDQIEDDMMERLNDDRIGFNKYNLIGHNFYRDLHGADPLNVDIFIASAA